MSATSLDHIGLACRDLDVTASLYERLGFTLTPRATHYAPGPLGTPEPTGTGNRCAMFREGYLELIAQIDPDRPSTTLARMLARHEGLHIIAFSIDDEQAELARLRAAGIAIDGVAWLERPIAIDGKIESARFARLPLPDAPEGKLQLIRHLTPELLWRRDLLSHANRVVALEEVVCAAAKPDETLARLEVLTGVPARQGLIALPRGRVRVVGSEPFLGVSGPTLPWIAGAVLRTEDGGAAIRHLATWRGRETEQGFLVPPDQAGGAALLFV